MSELDNDAWPQDTTLPQADGTALDDQAALAFEIAAMRVRASWDDLDSPAEVAATALGAPPLDPFAPISPPPPVQAVMQAPWSAPPGFSGAPEDALRPSHPASLFGSRAETPASTQPQAFPAQAPLAPAAPLPFAPQTSPSSVVDTAPMAYMLPPPAAVAGGPRPQTTPFEEATSAPTFLPSSKLASPKTVAAVVASVLLAGALWLMGGDDAPAEAGASSPSALSTPAPRVEASPAVPSSGAVVAAPVPTNPRPDERLAVAAPIPTSAALSGRVAQPVPTPRTVEAPSSKEADSSLHREAKSSDSRRSKRSPAPIAQPRAQRHESIASAKPPKRKESPRTSTAADSSKRKGTGFVSANPY